MHINELIDIDKLKIEYSHRQHKYEKLKDEVKLQLFRKNFKKTSSGLGIGLTIVKKILESYNGQIIIEDRIANNYSKGCKFILLIPEVI